MGTAHIRPIGVEDAAALRALGIQTFREAFGSQNSFADMEHYLNNKFSDTQLKSEIETEGSFFYFLEEDSSPIGYLKLNVGPAQSDNILPSAFEIERIYLKEAHHGKGYGQVLMDKSLDEAKKHGCNTVWLGVWEHNLKAIKFYEKNGFTAFSTHPFKLGGDDQTDILMKKPL